MFHLPNHIKLNEYEINMMKYHDIIQTLYCDKFMVKEIELFVRVVDDRFTVAKQTFYDDEIYINNIISYKKDTMTLWFHTIESEELQEYLLTLFISDLSTAIRCKKISDIR